MPNRYLASLVVGLCPGLALADITPADVLADWQARDAAYQAVTISYDLVTDTPDLIRLENLVLTFDIDLDFLSIDYRLTQSWLELQSTGDGRVAVRDPGAAQDTALTSMRFAGEEHESRSDTIYRYEESETVISGTPDEMIYESTIGSMIVSTEAIEGTPNQLTGASETQTNAITTDIVQRMVLTGGPSGRVEIFQTDSGTEMTMQTSPASDAGGETVSATMNVGPQQAEGWLELAGLATPSPSLADLSFDFTASLSGFSMAVSDDRLFGMKVDIDTGDVQLAFGAQGMRIGSDLRGMEISQKIFDADFIFGMDRFTTDMRAPFGPRSRMGTSAVSLDIEGLQIDEAILAMMDPTAALGRDGLDISLSAEAQTSALFDLNNPVALDDMQPPEIRTFRFESSGEYTDFNFDASGSGQMVDDMPVGTARISVTNLLSMVERLSQAGIITGSDSAMISGMAGMFFTPGPAPNSQQTTLESRADGSIFVNGQQVQ